MRRHAAVSSCPLGQGASRRLCGRGQVDAEPSGAVEGDAEPLSPGEREGEHCRSPFGSRGG